MTDGRLRAFVALDPDAAAVERLRALAASLRATTPGIRWVRPEGLHLTLRFLGATDAARAERVIERVQQAAAATPPATLPLGSLGMFPERGAPRVLWVGLALSPRLLALQQACEDAARAEGFPPEERPFAPHLTLGRWSEKLGGLGAKVRSAGNPPVRRAGLRPDRIARRTRPELPAVALGDVQLETLVLYRSRPQAGGSVYTPLRRVALGGVG